MEKSNVNIPEVLSQNWITISDNEFDLLSKFVYNNIGINLTDEKRNLLMGRLQKLLRQKKLSNFKEYYEYVINDKSGSALSELANYISTNHTFFYREHDHSEYFQKTVLKEIDERLKITGENDIRIWSAGCSSGEEPYTLLMLMMEHYGERYNLLNAGILATDISEKALDTAKKGIYSADRVKLLPEILKKKYFKKHPNGDWEVIERLKKEALFRKFNFMNPTFPFKKPFDVIFCRNVMIYFDMETRENLVEKFFNALLPGGYLFIGHSETIKRERHRFEFISPALYRKPY